MQPLHDIAGVFLVIVIGLALCALHKRRKWNRSRKDDPFEPVQLANIKKKPGWVSPSKANAGLKSDDTIVGIPTIVNFSRGETERTIAMNNKGIDMSGVSTVYGLSPAQSAPTGSMKMYTKTKAKSPDKGNSKKKGVKGKKGKKPTGMADVQSKTMPMPDADSSPPVSIM